MAQSPDQAATKPCLAERMYHEHPDASANRRALRNQSETYQVAGGTGQLPLPIAAGYQVHCESVWRHDDSGVYLG